MSVDIVVVSRDTRELTLACVRSVREERVVVVDNGSTDGTAEALAGEALVLREEEPRSFGAAANRGAAAGSAAYLLFLNSDARARPGAVHRLAETLAGRRDAVVACGRLIDPATGAPQRGFAIRGFPSVAGQIAVLTGLESVWPRGPLSRRQRLEDFDYETTRSIDAQPAGACLLCRRADFEAVGGFDEGFPFWFEDVDLVRRLQARGRVLYVHDAVFEHEGGASVRARPARELAASRYAGLIRYFDLHGRPAERVAIRAAVAVTATARGRLREAVSALGRHP